MFRIKECHKGFVVQIKKRTWYGKYYWTHYVSVYGIPSEPWYFKTYEHAVDELAIEVKKDCYYNGLS
jgi:hypothetical protein